VKRKAGEKRKLANTGSAADTHRRWCAHSPMATYFFHLHECGTVVPDEEGQGLPSQFNVRDAAKREARSIMAGEVQAGRLCLSCWIEVMDQNQKLLLVMPFKEALEVTGL